MGSGPCRRARVSLPELQQRRTDHPVVQRRRARPCRKHEGLLGRIRQTGGSRRQDRRDLADLQRCGPGHVAPSERSVFRAFDRDVRPRAQLQILGGERGRDRQSAPVRSSNFTIGRNARNLRTLASLSMRRRAPPMKEAFMTDNDNATLRPEPPLLETKRDLAGRGPRRWAAPAVFIGTLALGLGAYAATAATEGADWRQGVRLAF